MPTTIRIAALADAARIATLSTQLGYDMTAEKTTAALILLGQSSNDVVYVATDSDKVIGWMRILYTTRLVCSPYCEVVALIIDEDYRGQGIGRSLIDFSKPWCKKKECSKIVVRSNVVRHGAHSFYTTLGFSGVKEQKIFELKL